MLIINLPNIAKKSEPLSLNSTDGRRCHPLFTDPTTALNDVGPICPLFIFDQQKARNKLQASPPFSHILNIELMDFKFQDKI